MDDTVPRNVFDSLLDSLVAARKETEDLRKRLEQAERRIADLEKVTLSMRPMGVLHNAAPLPDRIEKIERWIEREKEAQAGEDW